MKRVILGTAGHIDHGKSQLVRALTGTDPDRLKEEKQRGISIELGFAFLDLSPEIRMGIVDVPGHEKFVRQMVAGSGGIDIAALVVALDEGVMPQTVEHLDILSLLDLRQGIVVLTKSDLVDEELAMLAEEDVRDLVKGTFLENAPMIRVSSKTGEGIDELKEKLLELATNAASRPVHGLLRLPIDRIFSIKGHGTIVTGTLISGQLKVGDEVEILPKGVKSSVRSLESHNTFEQQAYPGERVAVNLRGVEHDQISRGDVLTHPNSFEPSYIIDVKLKAIQRSDFSLTDRKKVRLHHYTADVEAMVVLPEKNALEGGEQSVAQLRTSSPVVPAAGDKFVIRAISPAVTLGGGTVVNPRGAKLKARSSRVFLETNREDDTAIVLSLVRSSGLKGVTRSELLGMSGLSASKLDKILDNIRNLKQAIQFDPAEKRLIHQDYFDLIKKKLLRKVSTFHQDQPLKEGISKQELRSTTPGSDKLFKSALDQLCGQKELIDQGDTVRLSSHKVKLHDNQEELLDRFYGLIKEGGVMPPLVKELLEVTKCDPKQARNLMALLEKNKKITKINQDMYFETTLLNDIKSKLIDRIRSTGGITPSKFQELTGSSRKYNIPLLEYFDKERVTLRVGDQRVLRGAGNSGGAGNSE